MTSHRQQVEEFSAGIGPVQLTYMITSGPTLVGSDTFSGAIHPVDGGENSSEAYTDRHGGHSTTREQLRHPHTSSTATFYHPVRAGTASSSRSTTPRIRPALAESKFKLGQTIPAKFVIEGCSRAISFNRRRARHSLGPTTWGHASDGGAEAALEPVIQMPLGTTSGRVVNTTSTGARRVLKQANIGSSRISPTAPRAIRRHLPKK